MEEKRQLADGQITVWQEGEGMIIDHANGLTIELTKEETEALVAWILETFQLEQEVARMDRLFSNLSSIEESYRKHFGRPRPPVTERKNF